MANTSAALAALDSLSAGLDALRSALASDPDPEPPTYDEIVETEADAHEQRVAADAAAAVAVIEATADAEVAVIEAQAAADVAVAEAVIEAETDQAVELLDAEPDPAEIEVELEPGEIVPDVELGELDELPADAIEIAESIVSDDLPELVPDEAPLPSHWYTRPRARPRMRLFS